MCKPLNKHRRAALDERFVLYDPEQLLDGPGDLVNLVCPFHGAYQVSLSRIDARYTQNKLKAPGCPGCRYSRVPDVEYLRQVKFRFRGRTSGGYWAELYPAHPDWTVMPHWKEPML
jgi:hypothetical protein